MQTIYEEDAYLCNKILSKNLNKIALARQIGRKGL